MINLIGQKNLLNTLNKYTITTLPHALCFIGASGSGKEAIATYIANKFNMVIKYIDENITAEQLIEYNQTPVRTMYILKLSKFTEKQQNQFLKILEDMSNTVYIALTAESEIGILPTILSRCVKFKMDAYTIDELKENSWVASADKQTQDLVFKVCKTPGQLIALNETIIKNLYTLCQTIIKSFKTTVYANCMKVITKINYKENYDKFDFNLFLNMLEYTAFEDYLDNKNNDSLKIYLFTNKRRQKLINKSYNKEAFMINFISDLWKELR